MSVIVSVVVVGACIAVVAWLVLQGEADQAATRSAPRVRDAAPRPPKPARAAPAKPRPPRPPRQPVAGRRPTRGSPPAPVVTAPVAAVVARGQPAPPTPWWVRARSAVLLGVVSAVLGVAAAAGVGLVLLLLYGFLRSSVG